MTISTQFAANIAYPRTALVLVIGAVLLSSGCARFLPADPYKNTKTVKVLEVPEGKERPAVDPSLAVPDGKTEWVDNGHAPPEVAKPAGAVPEIIEKPDAK
jgi:uncharacterized lipoprotein